MTNYHIAIQFFLQLTLILGFIRIVGILAKKIGQPQVVGEMIAGVLIGPSVFGLIAPDLQRALFPKETIPVIYVVAQLGLALYMFVIGVEFNVGLISSRAKKAIAVSVAGMVAPFVLGSLLTLYIFENFSFFSASVKLWEAMLFVGSAMSITAFPMLARILYEKGIAGTALGTLSLAAGSIDDACAWCLLAIVVASFSGSFSIAAFAIGGGILYALAICFVVRPLVAGLERKAREQQGLAPAQLGGIFVLLMLGCWYTDYVGIYAVFGAFLMGIAMPRGVVSKELCSKIEPLTTNLLLPLFFIYSGLNTRLDLLISPALAGVTVLVIGCACAGKGVACWLTARAMGEAPREAMAVGALMNARGLMELILLNIGLERGLITPTLFSVMVIMAIVTTLMASPLFELVYGRFVGSNVVNFEQPKLKITA